MKRGSWFVVRASQSAIRNSWESVIIQLDRTQTITTWSALGLLLAATITVGAFPDPDMFHEMALARQAVELGHLPLQDDFAYTPTRNPVVHHEWGTGAVLYGLTLLAGAAGILALKYIVAAAIGLGVVICARKRGAEAALLGPLLPLAIFLGMLGITTVRAQIFTLGGLACLLCFLEADRAGRRRWIGPWLVLYVLWLNLHAGFVVGVVVLGLYTAEQILRRAPTRHLLVTLVVMSALVAVNPYGLRFYPYLWEALTMDRPLITEWRPIWHVGPIILYMYGFSLLVVLYAAAKLGPQRLPGLIIVLLTAYAALRHQRHVSIYAVVWACYVPAYIRQTRLGEMLDTAWNKRRRAWIGAAALAGAVGLASMMYHRPWHLKIPVTPDDHSVMVYPAGAVDYLRRIQFQGNLLTPFTVGAFVTWNLYPDVRVSIDGRYEVAYPPELLAEHQILYQAKPGWRELLEKYPTDAVLTPLKRPLAEAISQLEGWHRVYVDDAYAVYATDDFSWPAVDNTGRTPSGRFP